MSKARHSLIGRLFADALSLEADEREKWLRAQDADEDTILEVIGLLRADENPLPAFAERKQAAESAAAPVIPGFDVGPVIGRGGMGVVYSAQQHRPRRQVAIKMLPFAVSKTLVGRFQREVEILGRLEHESIARIHSAGSSEGCPFLVMEFVEGQPLDEYQIQAQPTLDQTLQLFVKIAAGVAHAHARGVIHRDLKPANILVGEGGLPKVLDFGIARTLEEGADDSMTQAGMVIGTLAYMSPEQARGDGGVVDARSDVYALGALLFELLEGRLPIDLDGTTMTGAIDRICTRPAARLERRHGKLQRDLETIVATALAKDPARRYPTVEAIRDDVERCLTSRPILARPPSLLYTFSRLAQRNRVAFAASVLALLTLVVAVIVSLSFAVRVDRVNATLGRTNRELSAARSRAEEEAVRAVEQEAKAREEASAANEILRFVMDTLIEGDPTRVEEPTLREAIERVARDLEDRLQGQPVVRARLHRFVGRMFEAFGLPVLAERHLNDAEDLFLQHDPTHFERIPLRMERAHQALRNGRDLVALELVEEAQAALGGRAGDHAILRAAISAMEADACIAIAEFARARAAAQRALELLPKDHAAAIETRDLALFLLARCELAGGEIEAAITQLRRLVALRRERFGGAHPLLGEALHGLGVCLRVSGDLPGAAQAFEEAAQVQADTLGPKHTATLSTLREIALVLQMKGDLDGAAEQLRKVLGLYEASLGKGHPTCADLWIDLCNLQLSGGRPQEALASAKKAEQILQDAGPSASLVVSIAFAAHAQKAIGGPLTAAFDRAAEAALEVLPPGEEQLRYLRDAAKIAYREDQWKVALKWFDHVASLVEAGFGPLPAQHQRRERLSHLDALLEAKGIEVAADPIASQLSKWKETDPEPRWQRVALTLELELANHLGDDARATKAKAALGALPREDTP